MSYSIIDDKVHSASGSCSPKTSYRRFPAVVSGHRHYSPALARWINRGKRQLKLA
jgi:hypothetical protein